MVHTFQRSFKKSEDYIELVFKSLYPNLTWTDGRKYDFELPEGDKCELKVDFYSSAKTDNCFIESHSDFDKNKPGGPWQTNSHDLGVKWYVYAVGRANQVLWFDLIQLIEFMEQNKHEFKQVMVPNKTYRGAGYLVPRHLLLPLAIRIDNYRLD